MILRAAIEPIDGPAERREVEVTVEMFTQGRAEFDKLTPDGWRGVHIVTGPVNV